MKDEIYVLDTSAFLGGIDPNYLTGLELVTVPEVISEIKTKKIRELAEFSLNTGHLKVFRPTKEAIMSVSQVCEKSGDFKYLSQVDKQIIALAKMLKDEDKQPILITDDYSIQNVATILKLDFKPVQEKGIKRTLIWTTFCPGCEKEFPPKTSLRECDDCGTALKRYSQSNKNYL